MDARPCPGPGQPGAPAYRLPRNTCDTHVHVVGPFDRYPLVEKRVYTPPEATARDLENYLRVSGIDRVIVVHVTVAGTTPDITLDAMAQLGESARGAVLPEETVSDEQIAAWHRAGIRAARITGFGGEPLTEAKIRTIADKVAPYGWHLLYMSLGAEEWERLLPVLLDLPVEVCVDHMGGRLYDFDAGTDQPAFQSLLQTISDGSIWAKVSGYYRYSSDQSYPWPRSLPFAQALVGANPERLIWGSDWPYPALFHKPMHETEGPIDWLAQLDVPARDLERILVHNAAKLYDFPSDSTEAQADG